MKAKLDISIYPVKNQYWIVMNNNSFKKLFNCDNNLDKIKEWLNDNVIYSQELIPILESKFNQ